MQKEDIQWAVLGFLILIVVALVIKPLATGQPVNIGLPTQTPSPVPTTEIVRPITPKQTTPPVIPETSSATPTPTWDQSVQEVQFVDPSVYGVNLNQSFPNSTKIPPSDAALRNSSLVTYATFSGQYSGATQIIHIPFPYWELWYTVEPMSSDLQEQAEVSGIYILTPTQGVYQSGFTGSYSTAMPALTIQVMDADDPNRIARTISPPGGIDPSIWSSDDDPRPWKEKFFEGQKRYYFIVTAAILKSYQIDIKIPPSYAGKY
jgi:hypothetical protein